MKTSELIKRLQLVLAHSGDINVVLSENGLTRDPELLVLSNVYKTTTSRAEDVLVLNMPKRT